MGRSHRHIGFLEDEESIQVTDEDFHNVVRLMYAIPGCGSYGVSCAGHFNPDSEYDTFSPMPWSSLGIAVLPEMPHIPELLDIINKNTLSETNAWVGIKDKKHAPCDYDRYTPETDLTPYQIGQTKDKLYVALLEVRAGDNGCLDSVPDHCYSPIEIKGNEEAFELSKTRCSEIKDFWSGLTESIGRYNESHGFKNSDFTKQEFLPFR